MITWDKSKRQINLAKHSIDLADCGVVFDSPMLTQEDTRLAYGEKRLQSLGLFYGVVVFFLWVDKPSAPHFISCRKATTHEERIYWKTLGH
ncbi:MAG: BrnT family toxin [Methylophilaceae bacterium]